jgi:tetratricopeptide (TPR) repeat protein
MSDSENPMNVETRNLETRDESGRGLVKRFFDIDGDRLGGFLKGFAIRILFLLLALATFSGLADSVGQGFTRSTWESSYDSLQTSLIHSGIWFAGLTGVEMALRPAETITLEPEGAGFKVGKIEAGRFLQPIVDTVKDLRHYLAIVTMLVAAQLLILKVIQLYSLKFLVGFGAAACVVQYRRGTLFGNVGQLFIIFGIITYFLYPLALNVGIQGYHEYKVQAATAFSENMGVLKEKISDVDLIAITDFKQNIQRIKDITFGGIAVVWNTFVSLLFGEMLICVFIPILTLASIGFIMHQALTYMDMSAMAGALAGGAGKLVSSLGSHTRGRLSGGKRHEGVGTVRKDQVEQKGKKPGPKTLSCILLMLLILPFLSGCGREKEATTVEKAVVLVRSGNPNGAISLLHTFVQENPNSYKAHFVLGDAFLALNSSAKDEKHLYLARYYYDRAKELASNDAERNEAEDAYLDVKANMGRIQGPGDFLKLASKAEKTGNKDRAAFLLTKAGDLYFIAKDYKKALKAYERCREINIMSSGADELKLKLATVQYFMEEPDKCLDILKTVEAVKASPSSQLFLDPSFLKNAASILKVPVEYKSLLSLTKKVSEENQQVINKCLGDLYTTKYTEPAGQEKEKAVLLAHAWEILAGHVSNLGMPAEAKTEYERARSFYSFSGSEEDAVRIDKALAEINKS